MFTGIIETFAVLRKKEVEGENLHLSFFSKITNELKIDQSVAHNGVCLTVVKIEGDEYTVTAIKETLDRSNLSLVEVNDRVNIERCMKLGDRLDGHIVQGHVDATAKVAKIESFDGSTKYTFRLTEKVNHITVEKGSVTINGVSLTVVDSYDDGFSVAIIPYTQEFTNFGDFIVGTEVNIEFDIIGKYILRGERNA